MTALLRFSDLKARGLVRNWVTLRNWIDKNNFPPGIKLGPNTRAWSAESVDQWLASRPTAERDANQSKVAA